MLPTCVFEITFFSPLFPLSFFFIGVSIFGGGVCIYMICFFLISVPPRLGLLCELYFFLSFFTCGIKRKSTRRMKGQQDHGGEKCLFIFF